MKTPLRLLIVAIAVLLAPSARALSIYALTSESPSRLLLVDADVPADVLSVRTITGLDAGIVSLASTSGRLLASSTGSALPRIFTPLIQIPASRPRWPILRRIPRTSPRLFTRA